MKNLILLLVGLLLGSCLYAQQGCLNENYKLSKQPATMAVVPMVQNEKFLFKAIYKSLKKDSLSNIALASIDIVYNNMLNNSSLIKWLQTITKKEFLCADVKKGASITSLLSGEDMKNMVNALDKADIVIIATDFKDKKVKKPGAPGSTILTGRFRMYDLIKGALILDYKAQEKLPFILENDPKKMMETLVESFHTYYSKNFVSRNNIK